MDNYNEVLNMVIEETGCEELRTQKNLDLIENDILDSLAFINLIDNLSLAFGIDIQPTMVTADSWRTVENITKMVNDLIDKSR
jgi:acyl carrier protein